MSERRNFTTLKQCMVALGIVLNIVGAFIALNLRLPIYLDSVGTVLSGALLGPVYGVATGVLGSLISGITFDIYSLYYAPVQILTGLMAGWMFRTKWLSGWRLPLGGVAVSLPTSIASAVITAFLFRGHNLVGLFLSGHFDEQPRDESDFKLFFSSGFNGLCG